LGNSASLQIHQDPGDLVGQKIRTNWGKYNQSKFFLKKEEVESYLEQEDRI
jgi:hypothetical protein